MAEITLTKIRSLDNFKEPTAFMIFEILVALSGSGRRMISDSMSGISRGSDAGDFLIFLRFNSLKKILIKSKNRKN
jgi:hypothetical protein